MADNEKVWHVEVKGKPFGPFSAKQIRKGLKDGKLTPETLCFGPGMMKWEPIAWNAAFQPPKPPAEVHATYHREQLAHDIDFEIGGEEMQFVEIELDPGESVVAEAGSMMFKDASIGMEAVFGDGTESRGVFDSLVGAGKRLLTGENLFMTVFTAGMGGKQRIAFASPYPGKIIPLNLAELGGQMICQKDAFLCAAKGVAVDIAFQKRIGVGLFGGEGFIMQRLTGDGLAFVHAGGSIVNRPLGAGEQLHVDTGCLVALDPSVSYTIEYVGSIKSAIFGGEGIFFASLTGPGNVWLQSMPFSRLAGRIAQSMPRSTGVVGSGSSKGQGSILGDLGSLFED
ncbi:MAG: TIGR00266 family protein [Gammaproteobacteria bacterium]